MGHGANTSRTTPEAAQAGAGSPPPRRLKAPWRVEEERESYAVITADGQVITYVYFAEGIRRQVMGRLTRDEARRVARAIARLPELLAAEKR